jgi:hypothetical protein
VLFIYGVIGNSRLSPKTRSEAGRRERGGLLVLNPNRRNPAKCKCLVQLCIVGVVVLSPNIHDKKEMILISAVWIDSYYGGAPKSTHIMEIISRFFHWIRFQELNQRCEVDNRLSG